MFSRTVDYFNAAGSKKQELFIHNLSTADDLEKDMF
jgi:hypothetical protein